MLNNACARGTHPVGEDGDDDDADMGAQKPLLPTDITEPLLYPCI